MMPGRARAGMGLAGLGLLWVTWLGAPGALLGMALLLGTAYLLLREWARRTWILIALGLVALSGAALPSDLSGWRPWAVAAFVLLAFDGVLRGDAPAPAGGRLRTGLVVGCLLAGALAVAAWPPARTAFTGTNGPLLGATVLAALCTGVAAFLVGEDDPAEA